MGEEKHGRARRNPIMVCRHHRRISHLAKIVRAGERSIHNAVPLFGGGERHQFKIERFPIRIKQSAQMLPAGGMAQRVGNGARLVAPIWLIQLRAMPCHIWPLAHPFWPPKMLVAEQIMHMGELNHLLHEAQHLRLLVYQRPIKPTQFVVLAIGVVVSLLGAAHLIPHRQHRRALGNQEHRKEIFDLTSPQGVNRGVICRPLGATIPTKRRFLPILIVLPIG